MKQDPVIVKYRSVSITIYPAKGNFWRFTVNGQRIVRASLEKAKDEALTFCKTTFNGGNSLEDYTPEQLRACKRIIEADPQLQHVDEFVIWLKNRTAKKNCGKAVEEFMAAKEDNQGKSPHHVLTLRRHLAALPHKMNLGDIRPLDLPKLTGEPRTRTNRRNAWIGFFKWCLDLGYIPRPIGGKTAPQLLQKPIVVRSTPVTYTAAELQTLLENVSPQYLPWMALAAFAGFRTEEIIPHPTSLKRPLEWDDFNWDANIITVRPETSKIGKQRTVPILPTLRAWLLPYMECKGRIGPRLYPSNRPNKKAIAETTRLGDLIGGWKKNALRHSFITYRSAMVGLGKAAKEAGNSEAESKRSYDAGLSEAEAEKWFQIMPPPMKKSHPASDKKISPNIPEAQNRQAS